MELSAREIHPPSGRVRPGDYRNVLHPESGECTAGRIVGQDETIVPERHPVVVGDIAMEILEGISFRIDHHRRVHLDLPLGVASG